MLGEYVKNNYYAIFPNPSYHKNRETHFSILLNVKLKCRLRVWVKVRACRVCQGQLLCKIS